MWGVVQAAVSELDFDFAGYARRAPRARRAPALADPRFDDWLEDAAAAVTCPPRARCVIIGGGVGGHVDRLPPGASSAGATCVLLDRAELTSGSTFHSAGLVGQLRGSVSLTRMMMYSVELYRRLGGGEFDPGWTECGGIRLACTPERWEETRRQAGWAKTFGLPLELISAEEAQERFPLMSTDGVLGASWLPTDGYLDPSQLTYALADGARRGGCRDLSPHTRVTGIDVRGGACAACAPSAGDIECEVVVNAGGMFAAEIGRLAGVRVPIVPMAHEYLVTQPFRERVGAPTCRRCATPTCSSTSARRAAGW